MCDMCLHCQTEKNEETQLSGRLLLLQPGYNIVECDDGQIMWSALLQSTDCTIRSSWTNLPRTFDHTSSRTTIMNKLFCRDVVTNFVLKKW